MKTGRRHSGSLRQLPSGRYRSAPYRPRRSTEDCSSDFSQPDTRASVAVTYEVDMVRGQLAGSGRKPTETLRVYALRWVVERELSDRTRELYLGLLERQVLPSLGDVDLHVDQPASGENLAAGPVGLR